MEHTYLDNPHFPIVKNRYIVISGCSGGGKSSILSELATRGYQIVCEPGRQIIKEQIAIGSDGLPWVNLDKFLDLALSRYLYEFNQERACEGVIFFDRGIIDAVQLNTKQPPYFSQAAEKFRYHQTVFLVPPWEEIFVNDQERVHDFASAKKEFEELLVKYKNFGYQTVIIPKLSVKERADFILQILDGQSPSINRPDFFIQRAKRLLEWNKEKLTHSSKLRREEIHELFASEFIVIANGRRYAANDANYYEFLNQFRSDISSLEYTVQEYINEKSTVVMPLTAKVVRLNGKEEFFNAIMLIKFNSAGKIIHWQETYLIQ